MRRECEMQRCMTCQMRHRGHAFRTKANQHQTYPRQGLENVMISPMKMAYTLGRALSIIHHHPSLTPVTPFLPKLPLDMPLPLTH